MQVNRQSDIALEELAADYRRYLASVILFHLAAADAVGLGATDYQASSILDLEGPVTAGELAGRLGLSSGATTRAIDRLERTGYARRTRDADDRRRVLIEHTRARPARLDEILSTVTGPIAEVLRALSPTQMEGVAAYVRGAQHAYAEATAQVRPREAARAVT